MDGDSRDDLERGGVPVDMTDSELISTAAATDGCSSSSPTSSPDRDAISPASSEQNIPLLSQSQRLKPKVNIFSVSYPRRKPIKEQITKAGETEMSPFVQFLVWIWNGSRYSGLLCMAVASIIYCFMEVVSDVFTAQSIPLFEVAFTRCTIILVLSFLWLKRTRQPIFGATSSVRNLLVLRALMGYLSLLSFVYCIQRVPVSQAVILSFTTPIMAAIAARIILHEKLKIVEIGGLACSFFGVIFIFQPFLHGQAEAKEVSSYAKGTYHIYAVLVGLFSSLIGGVSYCFTRAGAKAVDQPVLTVFAFGLIASPGTVVSLAIFEGFVLPGFYSLLLMAVLGFSAFCAEVTLARGLQLEKTGKAVNVLYVEFMSRSSRPDLIFDPEVEKTAKQNRKRTKAQKAVSTVTLWFGQTKIVTISATTSDSGTDIEMDGADRNPNPGQNPNNSYMWELIGHSEDDPPLLFRCQRPKILSKSR